MHKMLVSVMGIAIVVLGLTASSSAQGQTVNGTLMDVACSSHHASEAGYTESHDKKCLLMASCVKSGYSLVTADKKVLKFDAKGNELALDLIKKTDREKNWTVAVDGTLSGDTIAVASIKVQ